MREIANAITLVVKVEGERQNITIVAVYAHEYEKHDHSNAFYETLK